MKCKNCGRQVGPEELKCPHCGADNEFALQHKQNMEGFEEKFEATEKEVAKSAKKISAIGTKAIVLVILLVGSIVLYMIAEANYKDPDTNAAKRRDGEQHAAEYAAQLDVLLQNGDYMGFVDFLYAHGIMDSSNKEYERFRNIRYGALTYHRCIQEMEEIIYHSTDPDYWDSLDSDISIFCMYLEGFYDTSNSNSGTGEKKDKYQAYMEDMREELKIAMKLYFSMDDEELEEFLNMKRGQQAVKIEEVIRSEK